MHITTLPYRAELLTREHTLEGVGDYAIRSAAESALIAALHPNKTSDIFIREMSPCQWAVVDAPSGLITGLITRRS